ncbi:MAG: hypothetical protein A2X25_15030 [Chloroflexi bacterium GWB2_49_20]|nr:MAG: hypothetical protein A2X25_15030 [Chloroflexi bacterium GWB2_49_20]OGN80446.1 MAG: hypothetical protein A2X26_12775 [Chloroflexi bacterium GWC2_49_37]OGN84270.1 MAG: hypothetical protein A2X27_12575 [Chloroflexi bacterium GWD2_49_16]
MKGLISTSVAIMAGLIVLVGYFFQIPILSDIRNLILDWAVTLAAIMVFIGVLNLLSINNSRIQTKQKGGFYSLILVISLLITLILGLLFKPGHPVMNFIFYSVQLPVERSLMALLAVTLLLASIHLLRRQPNLFSVIFLVTTLLILLGTAPLPFGVLPFFSDILRPFVAQVLAAAGARGILLGIALATLTTGLRVLFGVDRPYGGQ